MDRQEEYRRNALEAIEQSDRAKHPGDKASWLHIARKWLDLLPGREPTELERFDDHARTRGTGHSGSDSSH